MKIISLIVFCLVFWKAHAFDYIESKKVYDRNSGEEYISERRVGEASKVFYDTDDRSRLKFSAGKLNIVIKAGSYETAQKIKSVLDSEDMQKLYDEGYVPKFSSYNIVHPSRLMVTFLDKNILYKDNQVRSMYLEELVKLVDKREAEARKAAELERKNKREAAERRKAERISKIRKQVIKDFFKDLPFRANGLLYLGRELYRKAVQSARTEESTSTGAQSLNPEVVED